MSESYRRAVCELEKHATDVRVLALGFAGDVYVQEIRADVGEDTLYARVEIDAKILDYWKKEGTFEENIQARMVPFIECMTERAKEGPPQKESLR